MAKGGSNSLNSKRSRNAKPYDANNVSRLFPASARASRDKTRLPQRSFAPFPK